MNTALEVVVPATGSEIKVRKIPVKFTASMAKKEDVSLMDKLCQTLVKKGLLKIALKPWFTFLNVSDFKDGDHILLHDEETGLEVFYNFFDRKEEYAFVPNVPLGAEGKELYLFAGVFFNKANPKGFDMNEMDAANKTPA